MSGGARTSFLTAGERWLCQRSRHCLPIRLGRSAAIRLQLEGPSRSTSSSSLASSSALQAHFFTADLGAVGVERVVAGVVVGGIVLGGARLRATGAFGQTGTAGTLTGWASTGCDAGDSLG